MIFPSLLRLTGNSHKQSEGRIFYDSALFRYDHIRAILNNLYSLTTTSRFDSVVTSPTPSAIASALDCGLSLYSW